MPVFVQIFGIWTSLAPAFSFVSTLYMALDSAWYWVMTSSRLVFAPVLRALLPT